LITIYPAKKIHTMNRHQPVATHIAVKEGRILGVGTLDDLTVWGDYQINDIFKDKVLMPGLIEAHSHAVEGILWRHVYCGFFDRLSPSGEMAGGLRSIQEVVNRLKQAHQSQSTSASAAAPLSAWGLDPIYFGGVRLTRQDLDSVSTDRPIGVLHASTHIMNVNTRALEMAGLMKAGSTHPGILLGADGLPNGELRGPDLISIVGPHVGFDRDLLVCDGPGLKDFARLCVGRGVTTASDFANPLRDELVQMMDSVTGAPDFPIRLVALLRSQQLTGAALVDRAKTLKAKSTERLRLGIVKLVADGSIQGFSARMRWPGYFNGQPNGLWYISQKELVDTYRAALAQGIQVHTHANGDQAIEMVLDSMDEALRDRSAVDHRFTIQHCQLADAAMLRRMGRLRMCANFFSNHTFYWGEQHVNVTVGPERASRMNPCASAIAHGVSFAIHSDAPITPIDPLFTAWCAVNRQTVSGKTLGANECISVTQALEAITLGAAFTLKLDGEIGSLEVGKCADIAVLDADPYEIGAEHLKDTPVWGVMQGGRIFPAA
jgi:predicted amidohydrolase YtcJ